MICSDCKGNYITEGTTLIIKRDIFIFEKQIDCINCAEKYLSYLRRCYSHTFSLIRIRDKDLLSILKGISDPKFMTSITESRVK